MDPYLEAHWGDVHTRLTTYSSDLLQPSLPKGLVARIEEYVVLQDEQSRVRYRPDVIAKVQTSASGAMSSTAVAEPATSSEPLVVTFDDELETQRALRIVEAVTGRVITTIEFLSPFNKTPHDFREKQLSLLRAGVNLIEIDFIRGGPYVLTVPDFAVPDAYLGPYRIAVRRANRPKTAELYRASFRERLPQVRVPLRESDNDVILDLQQALNLVYGRGGYASTNYTVDPEPPLEGEDATWADQMLRAAGKRDGQEVTGENAGT